MFFKTYLLASILGLTLFGYGQNKGINLFDKEATQQTSQGSANRLSHK